MVNYVINAIGMFMLWFYIFRRKKLYDDYVQQWIPKTCMTMQIKHGLPISFSKNESFFSKGQY